MDGHQQERYIYVYCFKDLTLLTFSSTVTPFLYNSSAWWILEFAQAKTHSSELRGQEAGCT